MNEDLRIRLRREQVIERVVAFLLHTMEDEDDVHQVSDRIAAAATLLTSGVLTCNGK